MSSQNIFQAKEAMEGARNVIKYANIAEGEQVLIVASNPDPLILQLLEIAIDEVHASSSISIIPPPAFREREPPAAVAEALCAADTVLDAGAFISAHVTAADIASFDYGTKFCWFPDPSLEFLTSPAARFPLELYYAIAEKASEICQAGETVTIKSTTGTNLTANIDKENVGVDYALGDWDTLFPPGCMDIVPLDANGTAVFDLIFGVGRIPGEYTTCVFKDNYVTEITGGYAAGVLKSRIKRIKDANWFCEIMPGLSPAVVCDLTLRPPYGINTTTTRGCRGLHLGLGDHKNFGSTKSVQVGVNRIHNDGFIVNPTIYIDDKILTKEGYLTVLDEPEIRKLAGKYGDPDQVLKVPPIKGL